MCDIFSASGAALSDGLDIGYPILSTHSISSSVIIIIYRRDTMCKTQIIVQLITGQRWSAQSLAGDSQQKSSHLNLSTAKQHPTNSV